MMMSWLTDCVGKWLSRRDGLQGVILTFVFAFSVMGYLTIRTYEDHTPVPSQVVSESGEVLFTGDDILSGQETFLTYGLMQVGSVYGHGAYLGPDFTADYLHRAALRMIETYRGDAAGREKVRDAWQQNRYANREAETMFEASYD
jgi:nitric oxide reductase subunit B